MRECLYCHQYIDKSMSFASLFNQEKAYLCSECVSKLEKVQGGCRRCGKKTTDEICSDCLYWQSLQDTNKYLVNNTSLYYYNDFAKALIQQLKFLGDCKLLLAFKPDIQALFKKVKHNNIILVPVPLHEERLAERGFNQSYLLAKLIKLPILDIVIRNDNTKQSKKRKQARIVIDNQYQLKEEVDLTNKTIIIVDDIYTTGATIHKIARLFFNSGVKKIYSFTLFRS